MDFSWKMWRWTQFLKILWMKWLPWKRKNDEMMKCNRVMMMMMMNESSGNPRDTDRRMPRVFVRVFECVCCPFVIFTRKSNDGIVIGFFFYFFNRLLCSFYLYIVSYFFFYLLRFAQRYHSGIHYPQYFFIQNILRLMCSRL